MLSLHHGLLVFLLEIVQNSLHSFDRLADVGDEVVVGGQREGDVKCFKQSNNRILQVHCEIRSRKQLTRQIEERSEGCIVQEMPQSSDKTHLYTCIPGLLLGLVLQLAVTLVEGISHVQGRNSFYIDQRLSHDNV